MRVNIILVGTLAGIAAGMMALPAQALDWSKVPGRDVVMFYPGQTSWEWNLTEADHSAAAKFKVVSEGWWEFLTAHSPELQVRRIRRRGQAARRRERHAGCPSRQRGAE
jgi:hypothetical protein